MLDYLVSHAIRNVWCVPNQDLQFKTKLSRLSKSFGAISTFNVLWDTIELPTKTDRYHVFQIGHVDLPLIGLGGITHGWTNLVDLVNDSTLFCNVFYTDGLTLPKSLMYVHYDNNRNLVLAIKMDDNFKRLHTDDPYIRLYSNSYFRSEFATPEDGTFTRGGRVTSTAFVLAIQAELHSRLEKPGVCFAYHNGLLVNDFYPSLVKVGDYIEFDYDSSVVKIISLDVSDLNTFESTLDRKRKYLLTYPPFNDFESQKIDYLDDIDVYIRNKNVGNKKGLFYHGFTDDHLRMITHRDYSIPVDYITSYMHMNPDILPSASDISIVLYIRKTGLQRSLVHEANKLHELYKLDHDSVVASMVGFESHVPGWKAANLEASSYPEIMGRNDISLSNSDIINLYGYDAISKLVGDSPLKISDAGSVSLLAAHVAGSTVYEYDNDGLYLAKRFMADSSDYQRTNVMAKLVEVIIGRGGDTRGIVYDVASLPIDTTLNYRVYICSKFGNVPNYNWADITTSQLVKVVNGVMEITYDSLTEYVAILDDSKFIDYSLQLEVTSGIYKFSVLEDGVVSTIPAGEIRLIMNGRTLIKGIDFEGIWPEYHILNKEYLSDTGIQDIQIRASGFCNSEMKLQNFSKSGFVTQGYLSNNDRYDIIEDKVQSIVVDGKLKHISVLDFIDTGTGLVVDSSRNGAPYEMKETFVPLRGNLGRDGYSLKSISDAFNTEVANYMTLKYPQKDIGPLNPITSKYVLYSPFVTRLLRAMISREIPREILVGHYSDSTIRELCMPYLSLLKIDPARNADLRYVIVHPLPTSGVVDMNIYHHNFLQRVIAIYLEGKVNLSTHVTVTMPTEQIGDGSGDPERPDPVDPNPDPVDPVDPGPVDPDPVDPNPDPVDPVDPGPMILVIDTTKSMDGDIVDNVTVDLQWLGDFTINWGDDSESTVAQHTYATPGIYTITLVGTVAGHGDRYGVTNILKILQWGTNVIITNGEYFLSEGFYLTELPGVESTPTFAPGTSLEGFFIGCSLLNSPLEHWDVSNVTNMAGMFSECYGFDQPLAGWDTANVTDMSDMFYGANIFDQDLSGWDVSSVESYSDFDTESALTPEHLPEFGAVSGGDDVPAPNPPLDPALAHVLRIDTEAEPDAMGDGNRSITLGFEGDFLIDWGDGRFSTHSNHTYATAGIYEVRIVGNIGLPVGDVDSRPIKDRNRYMIRDILQWGTGLVFDNMNAMFANSNPWLTMPTDGTKPTFAPGASAYGAFYNVWGMNPDISNWDTSNITNMNKMFMFTSTFNQDLSGWDVSNVEFHEDFNSSSKLTPENIPLFGLVNVIKPMLITVDTRVTTIPPQYMDEPFTYGVDPSNVSINLWLDGNFTVDWGDGTVNSDSSHTYATAGIYEVRISGIIDYTVDKNGPPPFKGFITNVSDWGDLEIINGDVLLGFSSISTLPLNSSPNFAAGATALGMLIGCANLNSPLSHWDVSNVTNMSRMFSETAIFNQDLSGWDVSNVTEYEDFNYMSALTPENLPIWPVVVGAACPMLKNAGYSAGDIDGALRMPTFDVFGDPDGWKTADSSYRYSHTGCAPRLVYVETSGASYVSFVNMGSDKVNVRLYRFFGDDPATYELEEMTSGTETFDPPIPYTDEFGSGVRYSTKGIRLDNNREARDDILMLISATNSDGECEVLFRNEPV